MWMNAKRNFTTVMTMQNATILLDLSSAPAVRAILEMEAIALVGIFK